jgi:hypothetical protein
MTTASTTLPSPGLRDRLLARPLVRVVLALFSVLVPFALALWLSESVPKPWPANWPLLLAAAGIVGGYWLYVRRIEKRPVDELSGTGAWRELGSGLGLGALLVATCTLVLLATGTYTITGTAPPSVMLKPLGEQIMVAFFEEILFRAVMLRLLEKSWGTRIALTVSTFLFVLAHLPNEHFTVFAAVMTGVAALAFAAAWLVTRRLWLPIGLHFAWNYLFDAVLSVPVSGHTARGWVQLRVAGPEWLSGGGYGIEASVVTLVTWGAVAIGLLALAKRRGQWR